LGAREEDRSYGVDGEQRLVELGYGGGVVPVGIGQGGGVGELHQDTAELLVRSIEGGEGRRRGFDGEVELAGVRAERRRCSGAWK